MSHNTLYSILAEAMWAFPNYMRGKPQESSPRRMICIKKEKALAVNGHNLESYQIPHTVTSPVERREIRNFVTMRVNRMIQLMKEPDTF